MQLGVQGEFFKAQGAENQEEEGPEGEGVEGEAGEQKTDHLQLIQNIYASHEEQGSTELRDKVIDTLKPGNYEFLMKALAFLANNDLIFDGQLTSTRFMTPLKHV